MVYGVIVISCLSVGLMLIKSGFAVDGQINLFGDAISCFQCNSYNDSRCFDLSLASKDHEFNRPCPETLQRSMFCRKMHIKVTMENGTEHERIVRTCGWEPNKKNKDCYAISEKTHSETVCQCHTDGCNGAFSIVPQSTIVLLPLTWLIIGSLRTFIRAF